MRSNTLGRRLANWLFGEAEVTHLFQERVQLESRLDKLNERLNDITLVAGKGEGPTVPKAVRSKPRGPMPTLSYNRPSSSRRNIGESEAGVSYQPPQYDLAEIARARDIESIFQTSIERHVETALQEGWYLFGKDPKKVNYIYKRFWEIGLLSESTMTLLLAQVLDQLIAYGTALIVARRDDGRSSGRPIRYFGRTLEPISTLWVADAPTMRLGENKRGVVVRWKQSLARAGYGTGAGDRTFSANDVFVIARERQPGMVFGRPMVISVMDDIMTLRRLEELADIIPQKHLFPLFQVLVGTETHPAGDIDLGEGVSISEVEYAQQQIEEMPTEGGFVTPHRWEIRLIGAEGKVLDITPFLEHFRSRVQSGLRMNSIVMGSGGDPTKSVGNQQMKLLSDSARNLQMLVREGFAVIIRQLLMEGGFDITYDDEVELVFERPDTEEKRSEETHALAMYQGDLMSQEEARKSTGWDPVSKEHEGAMFLNRAHQRDVELTKIGAAAKASTAAGKAKSSKKSTSVRSQPRNQSGKKSTKTRVKAND